MKHYPWGGDRFLPALLGLPVEEGKPYAEYWLGSHPDGDASLPMLTDTSLRSFIQSHPAKVFPPAYSPPSSGLPFLLKILDVSDMLSIQVHPDKWTAERGYASEEASGIDRMAQNRVFRDDNHKPELMVALSEFWLVQGFMPLAAMRKTLAGRRELRQLSHILDERGLAHLYTYIMTSDQHDINALLKPLGRRIIPMYESNRLDKDNIDFWAARAFTTFNRKGICDRGILSLYLMNLVHLHKGEGIYQAPGELHAYLEGQNIECMAASDNVIRGGLTSKYVAMDLLIKVTNLEPTAPQIILPVKAGNGLATYDTPAEEFVLSVLAPQHSTKLPSGTAYLLFCVDGSFEITCGTGVSSIQSGDAFLILADDEAEIIPLQEGRLYAAAIKSS